jgi:hypothetical protein
VDIYLPIAEIAVNAPLIVALVLNVNEWNKN